MQAIIMWQLSGRVDQSSDLARVVPPAKGKTALREVLAGQDMVQEGQMYHTRHKVNGVWEKSGTYAINYNVCERYDASVGYWVTDGDVCDKWRERTRTVTHTDVSRWLTQWAQKDSISSLRGGVYLMRDDTEAHRISALIQAAGAGTLLVVPQPDPAQAARMALVQLADECTRLQGAGDCRDMLNTVSELKSCFSALEAKEADIVAEQIRSRLLQIERGY